MTDETTGLSAVELSNHLSKRQIGALSVEDVRFTLQSILQQSRENADFAKAVTSHFGVIFFFSLSHLFHRHSLYWML